ncbi:inositol monophosphatase family protein [Schumannella sp. 10F1B-5-1]|uniref:inositol monophosphatase family protein n=1 Tax=Schumannella sp. 10F1B-5-1 TaxID=2590780 RepID=UPI00113228DD|nr:inositol monophosphatase family protein [Schumannella sp. 10F1B-5-1]TPW70624.1 histidinol phosphatase [Schumannella sp. 10F1B-5-1]
MTAYSLADDLAVALSLAAEADLVSLDRYRAADLDVSLKADRTHVTDADTRVEKVIREQLDAARPGDTVFGEEYGGTLGAGRVWVIDPIDGTANFLRGVPIWGTLIALVVDGEPQLGVVSSPALGRRWWGATGHGAFVQQHGEEPRALHVSDVATLGEANISYNSFVGWDDEGRLEQLTALNRAAWRTRAIGDIWSYMLVAEGALDMAGEYDLKPWDLAPIAPIVREAGGRFSSLDGDDSLETGSALATNGHIHDEVLAITAR